MNEIKHSFFSTFKGYLTVITSVIAAVGAILAAESEPWWWCKAFSCRSQAPAPTVTLMVNPAAVFVGSTSTLTWSSTTATSCTASGGWSGSQATSGSTSSGALNSTTTYRLTCIGAGGSTDATSTVAVTQKQPKCPARTVTVPSKVISTDGSNARVVAGDAEIDSDDFTKVGVSYKVKRTQNNRGIQLSLNWYAQELNKNHSKGDTRIASEGTFPIFSVESSCPESQILSLDGLTTSDSAPTEYSGRVHTYSPFPPTGSLTNIKVRFDGPTSKDTKEQALRANVAEFTVRLSASP